MFRTNCVKWGFALLASLLVVALANPIALGLCGYRILSFAEQRDASGGFSFSACETVGTATCPDITKPYQGSSTCVAQMTQSACQEHTCWYCTTAAIRTKCISASAGTCTPNGGATPCGLQMFRTCSWSAGTFMCMCDTTLAFFGAGTCPYGNC